MSQRRGEFTIPRKLDCVCVFVCGEFGHMENLFGSNTQLKNLFFELVLQEVNAYMD